MEWIVIDGSGYEANPLIGNPPYGTYLAIASVGLTGVGLFALFSLEKPARLVLVGHLGMVALVVYLYFQHSNEVDEFGWTDDTRMELGPGAHLALAVTIGGSVFAAPGVISMAQDRLTKVRVEA